MSQEIQRCISTVYNAIDLFNSCYEFTEIRHWLLNSNLGRNENYLSVISQIDKQKKLITKNLTQLSESVDDLEVLINHSKHLVQLERNKDKQFAKYYEKYHIKLNRAVNENKM
jgi:phage anti-repressor protein